MQAILVKYTSPTNSRGGGYSARSAGASVRVGRDYSLSDAQDRARAASMLCQKLGWSGTMHEGTLPNGDHVFVFDNGSYALTVNFDGTAAHQKKRNRAGSTKRSARSRR